MSNVKELVDEDERAREYEAVATSEQAKPGRMTFIAGDGASDEVVTEISTEPVDVVAVQLAPAVLTVIPLNTSAPVAARTSVQSQ